MLISGHAHLTDFNIATRLQRDGLACSMSGTKPVNTTAEYLLFVSFFFLAFQLKQRNIEWKGCNEEKIDDNDDENVYI